VRSSRLCHWVPAPSFADISLSESVDMCYDYDGLFQKEPRTMRKVEAKIATSQFNGRKRGGERRVFAFIGHVAELRNSKDTQRCINDIPFLSMLSHRSVRQILALRNLIREGGS
jgi:hypothetical protein